MKLNARMEFGHVIRVHEDGTVSDPADVHGPEIVYLQLDADGQSLDDDFIDVPDGWTPMRGYTGQYGYNGPVMHSSEFIGGRMERDILSEPAFYVAVVVDGLPAEDSSDEDMNIGWAVFRKDIEE